MLLKDYYVYGYVRSAESAHGPIGSYYYIGKGRGHRKYSTQRLVSRPKDDRHIVTFAEHMSEQDALQLEMLLIHIYGRIDNISGCLRNRTDGGEGASGYDMPDDVKEKHSLSMQGRTLTPEHRSKLSAAKKGRPLSPEHKAKLSDANKGKSVSESHREKLRSAAKGRKLTDEQRAAISKSRTGKKRGPMSDDHKRKHSDAMKLSWERRRAAQEPPS